MNVLEETWNRKTYFIEGIKAAIPTLIGYISIGLSFGIVGSVSGFSVLEIALVSLLVYAGAGQFILFALFIANTPAAAIVFTIFIVNFRHLLMGLSVAPYLTQNSLLRNIGFGTLLTDETFGVAITEIMNKEKLNGYWMDGLNLTAYISWVLACVIGGYLGNWIPEAEKFGLDFALVAMFVALVILQLSSLKGKVMHYSKLILLTLLVIYILMHLMSVHLAVLLTTLIVSAVGVVTEK